MFKPSVAQQEIKAAVKDGEDNLLIEAGPGTGKTRTLEYVADAAPRGSLFLAFNKKIADELDSRLPPHVKGQTFHSLMFQFLKGRLNKRLKVNGWLSRNYFRGQVDEDSPVAEFDREFAQLVSLGKNLGVLVVFPNDREIWRDIIEAYDIEIPLEFIEEVVGLAIKFVNSPYKQGKPLPDEIDFDDMLLMPIYFAEKFGWMLPRYPLVFVDEAQDTNQLQRHILGKIADRIVAVGDKFQAIYGFRGASSDALGELEREFGCKRLPLMTSYRCPVSHVENANKINPELVAADGAIEGSIKEIQESALLFHVANQDLVLCRLNFPLFKVALQMLREKRPFTIGDKFVKQLLGFVNKFKSDTMQEFKQKLSAWWVTTEKELLEKKKMGRLTRERDKYEALMELQKECSSWDDLMRTLERLLRSENGVRLYTIHGAKGLEATRVFFLRPSLIPSEYAITEEQLAQETNLEYVAITRSKNELYFVEGSE